MKFREANQVAIALGIALIWTWKDLSAMLVPI